MKLKTSSAALLVHLSNTSREWCMSNISTLSRVLNVSISSMCCSTLQWPHNERIGVSNHQPHDCLLNRLFKAQIKVNIKAPRHWPLCVEFTGEINMCEINLKHLSQLLRKWTAQGLACVRNKLHCSVDSDRLKRHSKWYCSIEWLLTYPVIAQYKTKILHLQLTTTQHVIHPFLRIYILQSTMI